MGIIGCGFIGGVHSRALKGLHRGGLVDAPVVAVCDPDLERARSFGSAHGASLVTSDPAELLADVDVVWICTPTNTHRPLVEQACAAGVPFYCEKPLATTQADAESMWSTVLAARIPNQVGLVLRSSPALAQLHRMVADTAAHGRVMTVVLRDDQFLPNQGHYASTWRADPVQAGGGTLIEHSIHDLDVLSWLLGPIREVTGRTADFAGNEGIEDLATATLVHASGAVSMLVSVWHQVLTRPSTRRIEVFSERALFWLEEENEGPIHRLTDTGKDAFDDDVVAARLSLADLAIPEAWVGAILPYALADRSFLQALAAGREPAPNVRTALQAHCVADAIYRSAAAGGRPTRVALL